MSEEEFKAKFIEMLAILNGKVDVTNSEVSGLKKIVTIVNENQDKETAKNKEDIKAINSKLVKASWSLVGGLILTVVYFLKSGGIV